MAAPSTSSRLAAAARPRLDVVGVSGTWPAMLRRGGAGTHRARDAGATESAVAARVLGQVLLVVVLGVVERPGVGDLGRDLAQAALVQRRPVALARAARGFGLRGRCRVDGRAVLGPDVVALAHAL